MTSTKALFAHGINYILRDIQDCKEMYESGTEYLNKVKAKTNTQRYYERVYKITKELEQIKLQQLKYEKDLKQYIEYFSYTEEDFEKYNLHPATDEEIQADYIEDMKELEYDKTSGRGKYTQYEHEILVQNVHKFNKENNLPIVYF